MSTLEQALRYAAAPVLLRRPDKSTTAGGWVGYIVALPTSMWVLMLWLGAAHHEVSVRIPALGFWQTAIVYMTLSSVGWAVTSGIYMKLDQVVDYLKANSR